MTFDILVAAHLTDFILNFTLGQYKTHAVILTTIFCFSNLESNISRKKEKQNLLL